MKESRKQKLSMRQTLFPHFIRPNLSCFYYNSNLFFGRNDSTDFYDFFGQFLKHFIFEGQPQAPDDIYLSVERNLLLKANGGYSSAWSLF
ncbi:unnamed protein product [Porites evermanni]|uniref:Maturase K n=1 Tax=Porites evermanni TaxID=104178 RepID=A0ABN8Q3Y6_9CNID|nr:unnamed protein product [Porites evermanni]